jgi:DNA repair protein REV1
VAYSIGGKLEEIGIKLVKDIREVSKEKLISTLSPRRARRSGTTPAALIVPKSGNK